MSKSAIAIGAILAGLLFGACSSGADEPEPSTRNAGRQQASSPPTGWQKMSVEGFEFWLPPGYRGGETTMNMLDSVEEGLRHSALKAAGLDESRSLGDVFVLYAANLTPDQPHSLAADVTVLKYSLARRIDLEESVDKSIPPQTREFIVARDTVTLSTGMKGIRVAYDFRSRVLIEYYFQTQNAAWVISYAISKFEADAFDPVASIIDQSALTIVISD